MGEPLLKLLLHLYFYWIINYIYVIHSLTFYCLCCHEKLFSVNTEKYGSLLFDIFIIYQSVTFIYHSCDCISYNYIFPKLQLYDFISHLWLIICEIFVVYQSATFISQLRLYFSHLWLIFCNYDCISYNVTFSHFKLSHHYFVIFLLRGGWSLS